jgi:hypothetical protein
MGARTNWRIITLELRHADEMATTVGARLLDLAPTREAAMATRPHSA